MWICPRCGEESDDNFTACWNCQRERPGLGGHSLEREPGRSAVESRITASELPAVRGAAGAAVSQGTDEYLVVPFIGEIKYGFFRSQDARTVAEQLQSLINEHARRGWEFHGLHKVDIAVTPGCLASLLGASSHVVTYDQLVFKRVRRS